jgi:glutamate-1-semialdehyde 2,1-aminomutase
VRLVTGRIDIAGAWMSAACPNEATDAGAIHAAIADAYRARTPGSAASHARARRSLAGGTTGNLRHFPPYPLHFVSGDGSRMVDVDGLAYLDCFLANGPLLLGHRPPCVIEAVERAAPAGSLLVNPPLAIELAEEIRAVVPCAERVRFLNSGTEAVMTAVRLARAFTGRPRIVKFLGHYHGQDDQFLFGLDPQGLPFGSGLSADALAGTLLCRYGDPAALEALLASRDDVAAVLLDPAMHSGGLWGSTSAYLHAVRELTRRRGVLLVFDEVITGFRLAPGGAQELHAVVPDLATYAKALAAGEKLAAVVGSEAVMRCLDPERPAGVPAVFQSGTGNDGTVALAAGLAAVREYRRLHAAGEYAALAGRAQRLADGIRGACRARGVSCHVNQLGPMLQLFFTAESPSFEVFSRVPTAALASFYLALINEGILLSLPTSNHIYLSFAHTDTDIDAALAAVGRVLERYDFAALVRAQPTHA